MSGDTHFLSVLVRKLQDIALPPQRWQRIPRTAFYGRMHSLALLLLPYFETEEVASAKSCFKIPAASPQLLGVLLRFVLIAGRTVPR